MKSRLGFVSNSSSSSFIVAFEKPIERYKEEELKLLLFGTTNPEIDGYFHDHLNTDELLKCAVQNAEEVFLNEDLSFRNPESDKKSFYFPKDFWDASDTLRAEGFDFSSDEFEEYSKKIEEEMERTAKEEVKEFLEEIKRRKYVPTYYYFSFSDNDGPVYCYLEHEGVFESLPYMMENHH